MELKKLEIDRAEIKFLDSGAMKFAGYASRFGGVDSYGDTIDPKAYDRTIKPKNRERPIRLRWNHYGPVIGKFLDIGVDSAGLAVEGELTPGHSVAQDVYASMKHGAVDGLSIGFVPKKIEMLDGGGRLLKEIHLVEISVVEEPADLGARIADVKSALDEAQSLADIEALLREAAKFSRSDATALVSRIRNLVRGERESQINQAEAIRSLFQQITAA